MNVKILTLLLALVACSSTSVAAQGRSVEGREGNDRSSYFHKHGYTRLDIPKGHYPPPGECRIWYPDRPAGQQPPPGRCDRVPPGAWLIRHPNDDAEHVHVTVYDDRRPGTILAIGQFKIASGIFVRIVVSK